MKTNLSIFTLLICFTTLGQDSISWKKSALVLMPEFLLGKTMESNDGFPERTLQKQIVISVGRNQDNNPQSWAQELNKPTTGISLGITDFGNTDDLGYAISLLPFIEFKAFKQERLSVLASMGISYFNKKYNSHTNFSNKAVTTDLTWCVRFFLKYKIYETKNIDWKVEVGVAHHSNGHTRLLNQGYNSVLLGVSADIKNPLNKDIYNTTENFHLKKSSYGYVGLRTGYGKNVLALAFNNLKDVYTISGEIGKVYNNTYKIGLSVNYRFYEHYYDYIKGNESLVRDGKEFESYKENPWYNSTNLSVGIQGEILLNHIGINFEAAYNIYKLGYKIEWRINEGWDDTPREIPDNWVLGEYNNKYKLKQNISTRLGLKYYAFGTSDYRQHNLFIGAFLNANYGQADFTEIACGYVYNFNF